MIIQLLMGALLTSIVSIQAITESELIKIRLTYLNDHFSTFSSREIIETVKETTAIARKNNLDISLVLAHLKQYAQQQLKLCVQRSYRKIKKPDEFYFGASLTTIGALCLLCAHAAEHYKKASKNLTTNIGAGGLLACMMGIPFIYFSLFPSFDDNYYEQRRNDQTLLENCRLLIEQIDLKLNEIEKEKKLYQSKITSNITPINS